MGGEHEVPDGDETVVAHTVILADKPLLVDYGQNRQVEHDP